MRKAINPATGEVLVEVAGQWVPLPGQSTPSEAIPAPAGFEPAPDAPVPAFRPGTEIPAPAGMEPREASLPGTFGRSFLQGALAQPVQMTGTGVEAFGQLVGSPGTESIGRAIRGVGDAVSGALPDVQGPQSWADARRSGDYLAYLANLSGQGIGSIANAIATTMATGGAAALMRAGPAVIAAARQLGFVLPTSVQMYGEAVEGLRELGVDPEEANKIGLPVAAIGTVAEKFGLGEVAPRLFGEGAKLTGGVVARGLKRAGRAAVAEGFTEGPVQQGSQELAAYLAGAPKQDAEGAVTRILESTAGGALAGGPVGGALEAIAGRPAEEPAPAIPPPAGIHKEPPPPPPPIKTPLSSLPGRLPSPAEVAAQRRKRVEDALRPYVQRALREQRAAQSLRTFMDQARAIQGAPPVAAPVPPSSTSAPAAAPGLPIAADARGPAPVPPAGAGASRSRSTTALLAADDLMRAQLRQDEQAGAERSASLEAADQQQRAAEEKRARERIFTPGTRIVTDAAGQKLPAVDAGLTVRQDQSGKWAADWRYQPRRGTGEGAASQVVAASEAEARAGGLGSILRHIDAQLARDDISGADRLDLKAVRGQVVEEAQKATLPVRVEDAAAETEPNPTDGQKKAGNYKQGHVKVHGLDVAIETAKGQERSGTGPDGKPWAVEMPAHYGRIKRTEGADGEEVDVYLGDDIESDQVFVVDQFDAETGRFDEHKAVMGVGSASEAKRLYISAFDDGKGVRRFGGLKRMPVDEFKAWLAEGDTKAPVSSPGKERAAKAEVREDLVDPDEELSPDDRVQLEADEVEALADQYDFETTFPEPDQERLTEFMQVRGQNPFSGENDDDMPDGATIAGWHGEVIASLIDPLVTAELIERNLRRGDPDINPETGKPWNKAVAPERRAAARKASQERAQEAREQAQGFYAEYEDIYGPTYTELLGRHVDRLVRERVDAVEAEMQPAAPPAKVAKVAKDEPAASKPKKGKKEPPAPSPSDLARQEQERERRRAERAEQEKATAAREAQARASDEAIDLVTLTPETRLISGAIYRLGGSRILYRSRAAMGEFDGAEFVLVGDGRPFFSATGYYSANAFGGLPNNAGWLRATLEERRKELEADGKIGHVVGPHRESKERDDWHPSKAYRALFDVSGIIPRAINSALPLSREQAAQLLREAADAAAKRLEGITEEQAVAAQTGDDDRPVHWLRDSQRLIKAMRETAARLEANAAWPAAYAPIFDAYDKRETKGGLAVTNPWRDERAGDGPGPGEAPPEPEAAEPAAAADTAAKAPFEPPTLYPGPDIPEPGWWKDLTPAGKLAVTRRIMGDPTAIRIAKTLWRHMNAPTRRVLAERGEAEAAAITAAEEAADPRQSPASPAPMSISPTSNEAAKVNTPDPAYGAGNVMFTADMAEKARARIRAKLGGKQLTSGFDPELALDGLTLAGFHIEAGARSFAAYSRAMIGDMGEMVRPYLVQWYTAVWHQPGFDRTGMTPPAEIDEAPPPGDGGRPQDVVEPEAAPSEPPQPEAAPEASRAPVEPVQPDMLGGRDISERKMTLAERADAMMAEAIDDADGDLAEASDQLSYIAFPSGGPRVNESAAAKRDRTAARLAMRWIRRDLAKEEAAAQARGQATEKARADQASRREAARPLAQRNEIERIAGLYAAKLGRPVTDFHRDFARAIVDRNLGGVLFIANGVNPKGKATFTEATGIKLPKTQGGTRAVLAEWAATPGIDRPGETVDSGDVTTGGTDVPGSGQPAAAGDDRTGDAGPGAGDVRPAAGERGAAGGARRPAQGSRGDVPAQPGQGDGEGVDEPVGEPAGAGRPAGSDAPGRVGGSPADGAGVPKRGAGADRAGVAANFVAGPGAFQRTGSWLATAERNLDILELVNKLDAENRNATAEEQALLVRFTGWGASEIRQNLFQTATVDPDGVMRLHPDRVNTRWGDGAKWKPLVERAATLLEGDTLRAAMRSSQYAHYTSEGVIRGIWSAVERFGFKGGRVFEPGMGVGLFGVAAPAELSKASRYLGVEMDPFTAKIASYLLPEEQIMAADFVKTKLPDGYFDLAIGNPPFSQTVITDDPAYRRQRFVLHDYFFAKTIDKVRPGGVLVFVTSKGTMDKLDDKARAYLAERADLLGAIRLSQAAFKQNAGTEVVTDVIFLRKRYPGEERAGDDWLRNDSVSVGGKSVMINEYFVRHPEMVLGEHSMTGSMYRAEEYTVVPREGEDPEAAFRAAVERLPADIVTHHDAAPAAALTAEAERDFSAAAGRTEGEVYLTDKGQLAIVQDGSGVPLASTRQLKDEDAAWLRDYVPLRDLLRKAHADQLNDDPGWEKSLAALNKAYDAFAKKHGPIMAYTERERREVDEDGVEQVAVFKVYKNKARLALDVFSSVVFALERDAGGGNIVKGGFLNGRTIQRPEPPKIVTAQDALMVSLDARGRLDLGHIASLLDSTAEQVIADLGTSIYRVPGGDWQLADEYLSGDVRAKLEEARAAASLDPAYERNVEALTAALPLPLTSSQITVPVGSGWIPPKVIDAFIDEVLDEDAKATYEPSIGKWSITGSNLRNRAVRAKAATSEFGTSTRTPLELLDAVMNNREIRIMTPRTRDEAAKLDPVATAAAKEKADKIRQAFRGWVWRDAERVRELVTLYNERFNNIAPRRFDGSHLTLPGLNLRYKLHAHQKRAIWRVIQTGNTYLAHAVGAGKTLEMIVSAMEQKRLGLIRKPMFIVPNHMLLQFASEFVDAYPAARIMVADKEQFHTENRRRFLAQATLNDLDAVVIGHSAFGLIRTLPESRAAIVERMLAEIDAAIANNGGEDKRIMRRKLEQQREAIERRFGGKTSEETKDKPLAFEEMGVDFLYVDEAHEFRRLDFVTEMQAKGVSPEGSKRALDLFIKTRWLEGQRPGRSMVFASGTPVTNTMAELFTVMRYLDQAGIERDGIGSFDAWATMFGEMKVELEQNAAGTYENVGRFAKFVNVPEMMNRVRSFMDILTMSQLGELVDRPLIKGGKPQTVIVPASQAVTDYQKGELAERIRISREWKPSRDEPGNPDPLINIITDGRLSAIDMRFIAPGTKNDPNSKLNKMIDQIIATYKATAKAEYLDKETGKPHPRKGAAQIVFSAVGFGDQVAISRGFDARAWIYARLKKAGIPASEIAWMSDYDTDAKKQQMQKEMRDGRKRILFGSPKNMGTGLNVQNRLKALHYLSPPWYPADVEQPHGRILRQGNQNPEVEIYWYATKGTYDSTQWGMVSRKARFIEDAYSGDNSVRQIDDVSEASQYEMAAAMAAGDERAMRLAKLGGELERYHRLQAAHAQEQYDLRWKLESAEGAARRLQQQLKRYRAAYDATGGDFDLRAADEQGVEHTKQQEIGQGVLDAVDAALSAWEPATKDSFEPPRQIGMADRRFPIMVELDMVQSGKTFVASASAYIQVAGLKFHLLHQADIDAVRNVDPTEMVRRAWAEVRGIRSDIYRFERQLAEQQESIPRYRKLLGAPFEYATEMAEAVAEIATLKAELAAEGQKKAEAPAPVEVDDAALALLDEAMRAEWENEGGAVAPEPDAGPVRNDKRDKTFDEMAAEAEARERDLPSDPQAKKYVKAKATVEKLERQKADLARTDEMIAEREKDHAATIARIEAEKERGWEHRLQVEKDQFREWKRERLNDRRDAERQIGDRLRLAVQDVRDNERAYRRWLDSQGGTAPAGQPQFQRAERFARQVDQFLKGELEPHEVLDLGPTPLVLRRLGVTLPSLVMEQRALAHILRDHPEVTPDLIKRLPALLADPIAVLNSTTQPGSLVVMLDAVDALGAITVTPVAPKRVKQHVEAAVVTTYGQKPGWLAAQAEHPSQPLLYLNNEKSQRRSRSGGLQLPKEATIAGYRRKVLRPDDVFKGRSQVASGEAGAVVPAQVARAADETLRRILGDGYTLSLERAIATPDGGKAYGAYLRGVISIALDAPNAAGTARHEAIHFLREAGAIPPAAWQALQQQAAKWRREFGIDARYPGLTQEQLDEEAIAEAFAAWQPGQKGTHAKAAVAFGRLRRIMQALRDALRKLFGRLPTAEEVFAAIDRGDFAGRGRGARAGAAQYQRAVEEAPDYLPPGWVDHTRDAPPTIERGHEWVRKLGRREKSEFGAFYSGGRLVEAGTTGQANHLGFSGTLNSLIGQRGRLFAITHNHPSSTSLSAADIASLTLGPVQEIHAAGHDGALYSASLTPAAIKALDGRWGHDPAYEMASLHRAIGRAIYDIIGRHVHQTETLSPPQGSLAHSRAVNRILAEAGIIAYEERNAPPFPEEVATDPRYVAEVARLAANLRIKESKPDDFLATSPALAAARASGYAAPAGAVRPTGSVRSPGGVAEDGGRAADRGEGRFALGAVGGLGEPNRGLAEDAGGVAPRYQRSPIAPGPGGMSLADTMAALEDNNYGWLNRIVGAGRAGDVGHAIDRARILFQDRYLRLRRVQEAAERSLGRPLTDDEKPYAGEERIHSQVAEGKFRLDKDFKEPIAEAMQEAGLTLDEVDDYLTALHAGERNAYIASINGKLPDGGSGMTNGDALRILRRVRDGDARKKAALARIAGLTRRMLDARLNLLEASGILAPEQAATMRQQYRFYVPLRGKVDPDPEAEESLRAMPGRGLMGRRRVEPTATGRFTRAPDVLATAFVLADEAIVRAAKNRVGQELVNLARAAPDPEVWVIDPLQQKAVVDKATGKVRYIKHPHYRPEDTVTVREAGKEVRLQINDKLLLRALQGLGGVHQNALLSAVGQVTHMLARLNTTLSPEFVVTNALMDAQTGLVHLGIQDMPGLRRDVLKAWTPAFRGSLRYLSTGKADTAWARRAQEFRQAGGATAFNQQLDVADRVKDLRQAVADLQGGSKSALVRGGRRLMKAVEDTNNAIDNAMRLATYAALRDRGVSAARAASIAKNLTINFNRRGEMSQSINALIAFFNASVQGTAVMVSALRSAKVRRFVYAIAALGAIQELVGMMFPPPEDDDDELGLNVYERVPEWQKSRNLVLPYGTDPGDYVLIRMPYGYSALHGIGRLAVAYLRGAPELTGKPVTLGQTFAKMGNMLAEGVIPAGMAGALPGAPTVAEPFVEILGNRDYFDRPIAPESYPGDTRPDSQRYFNGVNPLARETAAWLNWLTGGDSFEPGLVDVSPESIEHVVTTFAGAAGSFVLRGINSMGDAGRELLGWNPENPDLGVNDVPFVRKALGSDSPYLARDATYRRLTELEVLDDRMKAARAPATRDLQEAARLRREYGPLLSLTDDGRKLRRTLSAIRKERLAILDGPRPTAEKRKLLDALEAREAKLMRAFNARYLRAVQRTQGDGMAEAA